MQTVFFSYDLSSGWSAELPKNLDSQQTLVLLFGDPALIGHPEPFQDLAAAFPTSSLMGCSTGGEILGARVYDERLVVAVVRFEHTVLSSAHVEARAESSLAAGRKLATRLVRPGLRLVFVLADGININGSDLVTGLREVLPSNVVVTGGLAADGSRFEKTWVILGDRPRTGQIAAIGFTGERLQVGHGSKGGWDIFGPERLVTRSSGRVLYELDGKPALELYKKYLGDLAADLPASALLFPLALRQSDAPATKEQVVRTILAINEEDQSMSFAGEIPEGWLAQLMKANFERIIEGAWQSAMAARRPVLGSPNSLAIAISCVGRRWLLGERTEEELERTLDMLPEGTQQIGYYSYGELSPVGTGPCSLHNQTMTLTTIAES